LKEVHEDAQNSLALELKKMREKAQITITGNCSREHSKK
jgi:hypothetical protein